MKTLRGGVRTSRGRVTCSVCGRRIARGTGRVHVTATVQGRTQGRMDPANVYPTVKALIDGIVDASVLADDDDRHLEGPDMRRGTPDPAMPAGWHRITLTITNL